MLNEAGRLGVGRAIALVDDDQEMRSMLEDYLSSFGLEVHSFPGPREFLKSMEESKGHFSLVVSDVNMPGTNGLEMLTTARKSRPDLPAVLMTAAPNSKDEAAAMSLGVRAYLKKPFRLSELLSQVKATVPGIVA